MIAVSAIICSRNPDQARLGLVLEALRAQSLPKEKWELLLVDNASRDYLSTICDLTWHSNGRHIREENIGLTMARVRGVEEAKSELLVFVDDDNVLAPNYLEKALEIADRWPMLGAWGGSLIGRFETPPPYWVEPYMRMLAVYQVERDVWSNLLKNMDTCPAGAGLVVRSNVAQAYVSNVAKDELRRGLDRIGDRLTSCGDLDLAYTACDLGLGTGLFKSLSLEHLIPSRRIQKSYLLKLMEAQAYSRILLNSFRNAETENFGRRKRFSRIRHFLMRLPILAKPKERIAHEFAAAVDRGRDAARKDLLTRHNNVSP